MKADENIISAMETGVIEHGAIEFDTIKPTRINRNIYSIMLFIIPAIYSYIILPDLKFTIACLICLITGFVHHYYRAKNKLLRIIDVTTVFSIIGYYTYLCISKAGLKFYTIIMYIFLGLTIAFYIFLCQNAHLYDDYHFILHILAITGVMFCIKSIKEYCGVCQTTSIECEELTAL